MTSSSGLVMGAMLWQVLPAMMPLGSRGGIGQERYAQAEAGKVPINIVALAAQDRQ